MKPSIHFALKTFRFQDEYDKEYEIFAILSNAGKWTSVILAGKSGSRRHSCKSFSENVVLAETSYQMFDCLILLRSGESLFSSNKDNSANFSGKKWKVQWSIPGGLFCSNIREKTFNQILYS